MARTEPSESKTVNEAALSWVRYAISFTAVAAAVVVGFAVDQARARSERAVPLLIVAAVDLAMGGRLVYRWWAFRRCVVGATRRGPDVAPGSTQGQ